MQQKARFRKTISKDYLLLKLFCEIYIRTEKHMPSNSVLRIIGIFLFLIFILSCVDVKKAVYFNNMPNSHIKNTITNYETVIQQNDLLSISISSLNPTASVIFNNPNVVNQSLSSNASNKIEGYLVDQDGCIQFPVLGIIKVAGMTKKDLKSLIIKGLTERELLSDPIVSIRYINFKVTVLGEVEHPTIVNVPNEKITLLEALGMAGDITIYGQRNNVMIIREENNEKIVERINLNSEELFTSPYYYLKANDIVYVQPNKSKVASTSRFTQWLSVVLSGLSFVAIIIDRVVK